MLDVKHSFERDGRLRVSQELEINVSGELEVARGVRNAGNLAKIGCPKIRCRARELNFVPGVEAVHFKDKRSDVLGQVEAAV